MGSSGSDIFTGTDGNDTALGNGGDDQLFGAGGSDRLEGGAGADTLDGGNGGNFLVSYIADSNFYLYPYSSSVSLDVYADHDILIGGIDDDYFAAGYGDTITGGGGYNRLYINFLGASAGVIADFTLQQAGGSITIGGGTISGITQTVNIQGSNFDDTIKSVGSYYGFSSLYGNGGNDYIVADYYNNYVSGGDGNDILDARGSQYTSVVDGDAGDDTIYVTSNGFARANGGEGNDLIYAGGNAYGGGGNDTIRLNFSYYANDANGEDGDDQLYAYASGSYLYGGSGADTLYGDIGNDTLISGSRSMATLGPAADAGLEHDVLIGGAGDDILWAGYGDDVDGGTGIDSLNLSFAGAASAVSFDSSAIVAGAAFTFGGGTITGVEKLVSVIGSGFSDVFNIVTQSVGMVVDGGAGNDELTSYSSSVTFNGGTGDDTFRSGLAGDVFDGGDGIDTIDYQAALAGGTITLGLLAGQSGAGFGGDQLTNVENVRGSSFNDVMNGSAGANILNGLAGDDMINGKGGDDNISGGDGADTLNGDDGNDLLSGGTGADILSGGGGGDKFIFASGDSLLTIGGNLAGGTITGLDVITDFTTGSVPATSDTLHYSGVMIAANSPSTSFVVNSVLQLHTGVT